MIENRILKSETTTIDKESGEIIVSSKQFTVKVNQDEFYMSYIENMSGFFKLKSAIDIKVLTKFCMLAEYNTGRVVLNSTVRKEVCELIKISNQQLTNSISSLKKLGLLKGDRNDYYVNYLVFWKGKNEIRNSLIRDNPLKVTIEFGY